jgi:hypothetical protein
MSERGSGATACSVTRLSDRIDDITGLNIEVGDHLQHHKSGYIYIYIYIYRYAKWITKLQSLRWGI